MLELKCQENARAIAQQIKSSGSSSASHTYSTTESMVGKWLDDSDVYEITMTIDIAFPYNEWATTEVDMTGVAKIIDCEAASFSGSGTVPINCAISGANKLQVMNMRNVSYGDTYKFYLTIRYIKSTT